MQSWTGDAELSTCGRYRWALHRRWAPGSRVLFVGLNPSTADGSQNDPTLRRCMDFGERWGFGALSVVNLYSWRTPHPTELWRAQAAGEDIVGSKTDQWIGDLACGSELVVACWGADPKAVSRGLQVAESLTSLGLSLHCIAHSKAGAPRHPLYLKKTLRPEPWPGA